MVRYADDFVILVRPGHEAEVLSRVKNWLVRAGLTLNERKTRVTQVDEGGRVEFLGFERVLANHFGKPDAGDPHVRFDEGDGSARGAVPTLQN